MTIKSKKFKKGIKLDPTTSPATEEGEIRNDSADNKLKTFTEGAEREVVTADQTQTLSNKTIDSANNTITVDADEATVQNLEVDNLKAGVLETDLNNIVDDTKLPSAQAVKTYVAQEVATKDEASEISYNNVTSGLTATNVQTAVDEVEGRLDTAESNISTNASNLSDHLADAVDAHDASAISNVPSGNLAATDVQSALNELQSDVDTRALDADLTAHLNDAVDAHDASAVSFNNVASGLTATDVQAAIDEVEGRLDTVEGAASGAQTSIDNHIADAVDAHDASAISNVPSGNLAATDVQAALNELQSDVDTRALNADLTAHTGASSGVHGVTGDVVGTTDAQTLTNKTLSGASIEAPTRLDVKQDTLANLTTYATTATNGQIVFATDTKQMFQVVDAGLTAIGGGGAGGSAFDQNQVAHGLAVLDAIYHNGTSWVKAQANDAATLATHIVSAVADANNFTAQNFGRFEATAHGKTVGEFYFLSESVAGGSDTVEGSVYSAPLYYVEDANTIHALVYRPSLRPQNTQFREDVDVLENILAFDTTSAGFSTETTINGESFRLTHDASVTRFAEVDLAVTPKFRDKILELPVDLKSTATSGNFKVIITDQTNSKTLADEVLQPQSGSETVKRVVSFSTKPADGDLAIATIRVRFEALAESGAISDFDDVLVQLKKTQSLEVIAIEQEENVFSARIQDAPVPVITSQSSSFISSVTRPSTGRYEVFFKPGFFSEVPSVVATMENRDGRETTVNSVSTTSCIINITDGGVQENNNFSLHIQRQGSDYRNLERRIEREVSTFKEVLVEEADSFIDVGGVGNGLSGAQTLTFSSINKSLGSDISYNASTGQFTVQSAGVYHAAVMDEASVAGAEVSVRINNEARNLQTIHIGNLRHSISWHGYLEVGDIISFYNSNTRGTGGSRRATITKQGSLKKASVAPDSKIKIPTSELRMEGSSSRGSGSELFTVQFNTLTKIRGNSVTVNNSNGSVFTVQKDGKLSLSVSFRASVSGQQAYITKNSANPATFPSTSEILASDRSNSVDYTYSMSCEIFVKAGDVLRVACENAPTNVDYNVLEITHQEQDISVAVSNVTPQFEDADSMVSLNTPNGYGSTATKIRRFSTVEQNLGSAITYADSATDGASFTINETGFYSISYVDQHSGSGGYFGISKNASSLTADVFALDANERLSIESVNGFNGADFQSTSWSGVLQAGDVIRPHTNGVLNGGVSPRFTIAKVGVPSIAEVDVTPFVNLDQYRTKYHSVRAEGNGGQVITANVTDIPFNIVEDSSGAWNGSQYTVQEDDSILKVKGLVFYTAVSNRRIEVYVNGSFYKGLNPTNNGASTSLVEIAYVSSKGEFLKGDVISFRDVTGGTLSNNSFFHWVNIIEEYEEVGRSKFHSIAQTENEFSARIANNGVASIVSESETFIDTVVRQSTGDVRITFKSGFFTEVPKVTVSSDSNNNGVIATWRNLTTNSVDVVTYLTNGAGADNNFNIHVSRQGADRKDLQNAIVQLSDFPRVNRTLTQELRHTAVGTSLLDANAEVRFNTSNISNNGSNLISVEDDAANTRTKFVANRKCKVDVNFSAVPTLTDYGLQILKNDSTIQVSALIHNTGRYTSVSDSIILEPGDYITVGARGGQAIEVGSNPVNLGITAEAQELERISNVEADGEFLYTDFVPNFWDSTGDVLQFDPSLVVGLSTSSNLEVVSSVSTPNGTADTLVAKRDIEVSVDLSSRMGGNSALVIYGFIDGQHISIATSTMEAIASYDNFVSATFKLKKGEYFYLRDTNPVGTRNAALTMFIKPSLSSVVVGLNPNTIEEKILSANVTTTGDIADLQFTNLEVGKWYHLTGQFSNTVNNQTNVLRFRSGASGTGDLFGKLTTSTSVGNTPCSAVSVKFKATSTNLYANLASADGTVFGDGTKEQTFLQLEKLSNTEG